MEVLPLILHVVGEGKTTDQLAYGANKSDPLSGGSMTAQVHCLHYTESSKFCYSMASQAVSTGSTGVRTERLGGL